MSEGKATKKPTAGTTAPSQFRLSADTKADLDLIAEERTQETGVVHSRTDAVRLAAKKEADRIRKKRGEKT